MNDLTGEQKVRKKANMLRRKSMAKLQRTKEKICEILETERKATTQIWCQPNLEKKAWSFD